MLNSVRYCLLFLLLFQATTLHAQLYNFKKYTTTNGLANSNINTIYQSSDGYLWFCTQGGGVSRFNGKEFKTFTRTDGLVGNDVTSICEDKHKNIWIGTTAGVSKFNGTSFTNYHTEKDVGSSVVYAIQEARNGDLWFATLHHGIKIFRNNTFISIDTAKGLPTNSVFCLLQDNKGFFWAGLFKEGICKLDQDGKILEQHKAFSSEKKQYSAFSLAQDARGTLWIGSVTTGIFTFQQGKFTSISLPEIEGDIIGKIIFDKRKTAWIATEHGLLKIDPEGNHKFFREKDGLTSEKIQTVYEDYEGHLWVGTLGGGACMLKDESVVTYTANDGLSNNKIYGVLQTSKGTVLSGTFTGVDVMRAGVFKKLSSIKALENVSVSALFEDSRERIWIGTETQGLFVVEETKTDFKLLQHIPPEHKTANLTQVYKIIEATDNSVWLTCYGHGIFKINPDNSIEHFGVEQGLPSNDVMAAFTDTKGKLWFSAYAHGVFTYENGAFHPFKDSTIAALNAVFSICGDEEGNVYFGTQEGGLVVWDSKRLYQLNTKAGLCSNLINSLSWHNGYLWLGTDKGVNKISLEPNFELKTNVYYGLDQGFKSQEINYNVIFTEKSGITWFGTLDGLTRYHPHFDFPGTASPKLMLTDIKLNYDYVNWSKLCDTLDPFTSLPVNPVLSYKNNHLTFVFQALTTDNVNYSFSLEEEGSEDWSPPGPKNEAVFTHLIPGKYVLKVKVKNSTGVEGASIIQFPFTITPPFWKTWWFYTLCFIFTLGGIIIFIRMRTKHLKNEKRLLEQKVQERTLELELTNNKLFDALHDIKDSINYAELIQRAMLPASENITAHLPQSFIFFKPRDIVSGDFYWFHHKNGIDYIAAVDCTGHGVPGAFMSLVGNSLLNEIVLSKNTSNPAEILKLLNMGVHDSLKQVENQTRDGMDIAFCAIDRPNNKLRYAGANRALWMIRHNSQEVEEIKSTKSAIGGFTDHYQEYAVHELNINPGDIIYLSSDGYADQFGGAKGKKLMTKKFKEILLSIKNTAPNKQAVLLEKEINDWMNNTYEQVDDMLVIGIRF